MSSITAQPVVCGVDESSEARAAAHLAGVLAARLDVPLILAHVCQPAASASAAPPPLGGAALGHPTLAYMEEVEERARETGRTLLDDLGRTLPVAAQTELLTGDTVRALGELADEREASLLVVGAHRRGALARAVSGTAWCRLAIEDHCPVVVVPSDVDVSAAGPVVAGFDGSEDSERAVLTAAALAATLGERLLIVNVVGDTATDVPLDAVTAQRLRHAATAAVDTGEVHSDSPRPSIDAQSVIRHGEPHEQLARAAADEGASLIVTGSRGRGPWRAAVLGSVSAGVAEIAPRPVVIVPPIT